MDIDATLADRMTGGHFLSTATEAGRAHSRAAIALAHADTGAVVAGQVEIAGDSAARKRGLLGRDGLPPGAALVIAPCSAVHTFGMRFAIDVIFADRDGRVLKIAANVRPRRLAVAWGAFAAIEMAAGEAGRLGVQVGGVLSARPQ
ncbi:MAG TPA: DUF192 domain-containing protein [Vicinamibacterales bacterium]|nr:DUF192 domain-containing protein [Vicinamibacterales bacterium]